LKELVGSGIVLVVLDRRLLLDVLSGDFVSALDDKTTFVAISPSDV